MSNSLFLMIDSVHFTCFINILGGILNTIENCFMRTIVFLVLFVCLSCLPYQNVITAVRLSVIKYSVINGTLKAYPQILIHL